MGLSRRGSSRSNDMAWPGFVDAVTTLLMVLMFVLIGFALLGLVLIGAVVLVVIAGVKANDGVVYRYPFTWRPIK